MARSPCGLSRRSGLPARPCAQRNSWRVSLSWKAGSQVCDRPSGRGSKTRTPRHRTTDTPGEGKGTFRTARPLRNRGRKTKDKEQRQEDKGQRTKDKGSERFAAIEGSGCFSLCPLPLALCPFPSAL